MAKEKLTPLSDPDNVQFYVVEDYTPDEDGFDDAEIQRLLNGQPLDAVVAGATFAPNEDKYDSGGMIALIPSEADLDRLTLEGEEPRDDLHLTLWYLGDDTLDEQQREDVLRHTVTAASQWNPIEGNAFGIAHWNPTGEKPAWVLNVGDAHDETTDDGSSNLTKIRGEIGQLVSEDFVFPPQHTPWQPHICIAYSSDDLDDDLLERLGPVTFDKVRVAFGRDVYDVELDGSGNDDGVIASAETFHLPGKHEQKKHGNRHAKSASPASEQVSTPKISPADLRIDPAESTVGYVIVSKKDRIFASPDGKKFTIAKQGKIGGHQVSQLFANKLYQLAGVDVPDAQVVTLDGQGTTTHPSTYIESVKLDVVENGKKDLESRISDADYKRKLHENFAIDAWLANTDVLGKSLGNVVTNENGDPVRTDFSGALDRDVTGGYKTGFYNEVHEIDSMRDSFVNFGNGQVFGDITDDDIRKGVAKIEAITPEDIDELANAIASVHGGKSGVGKLAETLKARRAYLIDRFGSKSDSSPDVEQPASEPSPEEVPTPASSGKNYTSEQKAKVESSFAEKGLKWHSDSKKLFTAAVDVAKENPDLDIGDVLNIMDQSLKSKTGNPFYTKIDKYLQSNSGKAYAESIGVFAPPRQIDAAEARNLQSRMNKLTPPPWTKEEKQALRRYTGDDYDAINRCLRFGGKACWGQESAIADIKSAMKPTPESIVVFRKAGLASLGINSPEDAQALVGKVVQDKGAVSTSIDSSVWGGDVHMQIEVPRGSKMAWVKSVSKHPHENEVMLAPGTHFEVIDIIPPEGDISDPKNHYKVKLRVVPGSEAQ